MSEQVLSAEQAHAAGPVRPRRPRSEVRGALTDVGAVLAVFVAVGVLCGLVWWQLVDPATFTKTGNGASMGEIALGKRFNADGWYAVLAGAAGLLAGGLVTWWRSRDYVLTTALVVLGAAVAAALMARIGHLLGPGAPGVALAAAQAGEQVPVRLVVTAKAAYLVWPIAVLIGALFVLWSTPKKVVDNFGDRSGESGQA